MTDKRSNSKGAILEEVLRAYFLRAGFFVVRGVPFRCEGEDLTDIDLWLYERPTGTSRRVQICDIKYKQRPKAIERILWTSGLVDAINVDGAYVATTDKRKNLRAIADKLNIQLIDGIDIQSIQSNSNVLYANRISDEQLIAGLQSVDKAFRNKDLQDARISILTSLSEGFGSMSVVRSLDDFVRLARTVITYQPNSEAARSGGRLAYLAAAITCQSLDFVSVGAGFQTLEKRRDLILKSIKFGALADSNQLVIQSALALVEKYAPNGRGTAIAIRNKLHQELDKIPADIVADEAVRLLKVNQLFTTGCELEMAGYHSCLPTFDNLNMHTKSMLGSLLDYAGVNRERFANAWTSDYTMMRPGTVEDEHAKTIFQKELF